MLKSLPKEVRDSSPAQIGLDYCNRLFQLESDFAEQKLSFRSDTRPAWNALSQ